MVTKKRSRLSRFFGFIMFRALPFFLLLGILGFTYGTTQAVMRRINEQVDADQRSGFYAGTAAAVAPTLTTYTPQPSATFPPTATATDEPTKTTIPSPTLTATLIPTNSPTASPAATDTLVPTATETIAPTIVAQAFATNTPRVMAVTLPAINTAVPSPTAILSETATPTSTFTEARQKHRCRPPLRHHAHYQLC
jgi:hypothetical protein